MPVVKNKGPLHPVVIHIGAFEIRPSLVGDPDKICIVKAGGEGGDFNADDLAAAISEFFEGRF